MTRKDLTCVHEPFGDAFYFGYCLFECRNSAQSNVFSSPERMSVRYEDDEETRQSSGFGDFTYQNIFDTLKREADKV